jgi:hypothetical protein
VLKVGLLFCFVGLQFNSIIFLGEGGATGQVDCSKSSRSKEFLKFVVVGFADMSELAAKTALLLFEERKLDIYLLRLHHLGCV